LDLTFATRISGQIGSECQIHSTSPPDHALRRAFYLIALPAVFVIGLGKGAFGGGPALIGIPLLALVVDPVDAAIMVALLSFSNIFKIVPYL
jgi:hypothetical protein